MLTAYQSALTWVLSFADYERNPVVKYSSAEFNLPRMEALLARLANPHRASPVIHIAGTKGKGSTAALVASALSKAGYRVGLYTSPHLHTFRERMRIGRRLITEEEVAALVARLRPEAETLNAQGTLGQVTTFELITALAFLFFEGRVDVQVLEVGLGGRLDSTNVCQPEVCVITSLSYDHTQILGRTLSEIAYEKAGILKAGALAVSAPQAPEAMAVVEDAAWSKGVPLTVAGRDVTWEPIRQDLDGQSVRIQGLRDSYDIWLPLLGDHQVENAAVAVATLELAGRRGLIVPAYAIIAGFRDVSWPGRLQVLERKPLVIADGAHNPYSMACLRNALRGHFPFRKAFVVIGLSADKDAPGILHELASLGCKLIAVRSRHPRAADPAQLVAEARRLGMEAVSAPTVADGLALARREAQPDDLVCATGSLFVAAEAIEAVCGITPEVLPLPSKVAPAR
ncbi:MAG: folylpolyglutamate synthase/dihydrofolate synthase family protein [Dehalococcoidia bacterium]|nr:folylpolyglutamate synthase/dihydrofolate synthase family protein [Dehalococcoidia bacterium]